MNRNEENKIGTPLYPLDTAALREYAYAHGNDIYDFMNKYDIGKSAYGSLMDKAAEGQHVIAHRLFGHHLIYDLPMDDPKAIASFLEHDFSDLFTKQGLPIIPGEILQDSGMIRYCDGLTHNWNFINGFDILSATIAIYKSIGALKVAFKNEYAIQDIEDFAKSIGVGVLEAAIAFSTANPFLLIGAALQLTAGVRALLNQGCVVSFSLKQRVYRIDVQLDQISLSKIQHAYNLEVIQKQLNLKEIQKGYNLGYHR